MSRTKAFVVLALTEAEARAVLHGLELALCVSGRGPMKRVPVLGSTVYPHGEREIAALNRVVKRVRPLFLDGIWFKHVGEEKARAEREREEDRLEREAQARRRPSEEVARKTIEEFLANQGLGDASFTLMRNGDSASAPNRCGWAFFIRPDDTTSYLHEDLTVEWYGTIWESGQDRFGEDGEDLETDDTENREGPASTERAGGGDS